MWPLEMLKAKILPGLHTVVDFTMIRRTLVKTVLKLVVKYIKIIHKL